VVWLSLDAAAAGFGIWSTHFIAILAYDPGAGAGYNLGLTVFFLLIAALITGAGLSLALRNFGRLLRLNNKLELGGRFGTASRVLRD
jgi:NO-binding membrane sensor protein with MHYT domain